VEAPGIEPGSENSEATGVYVRIRSIRSSRIAPTERLSSGLFTCLISPRPRWPGLWPASLLTVFQRHRQAPWSTGFQTCCLGSESNCVIVRNYICPEIFTWSLSSHGTQHDGRDLRRSRSPPWRL